MSAATISVVSFESALARVNGRRRTRLLSAEYIQDVANNLSAGEYAFCHGGHVANSYGYAAVATGAVVWKDVCGTAWAVIREVNATKGCTGFGRYDRWVAPADPVAAGAVQVG